MDRKGTNTINTFLKLNLSPLPLTEKPVENKCERFAQSIPAVTQYPSAGLQAGAFIPLMPNLARCYSFSPGPKPI